ncbi:hypothetical protein HUJ05_002195 [Dendroctonus ponderosae]|nr:hypothetical protein HUJ05_002195 [Dendroctonus ponderosae]
MPVATKPISTLIEKEDLPAEFETAIAATKFGLFNIILIMLSVPVFWCLQCDSNLVSFIIPAAACDLGLDDTQKSLLNSMPFFGMLSSGFISGYLLDTVGRRKVLFLGFCIETLVILGKSVSSNFAFLSLFCFFGGIISGSLYAAMITYILEFHSTEYRGRVQMIIGFIYSCGHILLPLLSSAILPMNLHFSVSFIRFRAWNLLLLISGANSIISMVAFYFLPETPKFLMSSGKNEEALRLFSKMHKINIRDPTMAYPVNQLIEEIVLNKPMQSGKKSGFFSLIWKQIAPLFGQKYRGKLMLAGAIEGLILIGTNSMQLFMPQIFQAAHEYQVAHDGQSTDLCNILKTSTGAQQNDGCTVNLDGNFLVYLNSMTIAGVRLFGYTLCGTLINLLGSRRLLLVLGLLAAVSIGCLAWSSNTLTTLALSSVFLTTSDIGFDVFLTVAVVLFPTTLRAMALSCVLFVGRCLTVCGNMLLPILLNFSCRAPFLFFGSLILSMNENSIRTHA